MPNYKELCKRLDKIPKQLVSEHIFSREVCSRKMFFVNNNYDGLIEQMACHMKIRLDNETNEKIIKEMKNNIFFRNFICVNLQHILFNLQRRYSNFIENFGEERFKKTDLKLVKKFGFLKNKSQNILNLLDDEKEIDYYYDIFEKYKNSLKYFLGIDEKVDFEKHIKKPFKKLFEILGFNSYFENEEIIYLKENITEEKIQNMFSCLQFHTFFEDYINSLFDEKSILSKNPIVLINPQLKNNILDGYVELDGSFLKKDNELIFLECKNSSHITLDHVISFIGKAHLIEKIYGLKIRKMLFSTGSRYPIWWDLEEYPELKDIEIYDVRNFRRNYKGMKI